jgi:NADPH:quinone reductase-like Zn-dependent oxidoreductase
VAAAGDWVLVHAAAGGTGLLLTQIVKHLGGRVIGTTSTPEKAAAAQQAGAEEVCVSWSEGSTEDELCTTVDSCLLCCRALQRVDLMGRSVPAPAAGRR